mmetsp:Transcript_44233/g.125139  ORF Transcript_44233/g.125139 Transcript_44233/m.125139 type:complete len:150 (+) Transcript_44233:39-488(+)
MTTHTYTVHASTCRQNSASTSLMPPALDPSIHPAVQSVSVRDSLTSQPAITCKEGKPPIHPIPPVSEKHRHSRERHSLTRCGMAMPFAARHQDVQTYGRLGNVRSYADGACWRGVWQRPAKGGNQPADTSKIHREPGRHVGGSLSDYMR